jgi:cytochrome o ubiquinol oxidase subunit 2
MGSFRGSSAHLSGRGFAGMVFETKVSSETDFQNWVESVQRSLTPLNKEEYNRLVEPSENNQVAYYILKEQDLYEAIVTKYMVPKPKGERDR